MFKNKKTIITLIITICFWQISFAQNIGIGTTTPKPSAILDIESSDKGLLVPRMNDAQRDLIIAEDGLIIYNLDQNCMQVYSQPLGKWFSLTQLPDGLSNGDLLYWYSGKWDVLPVGLPGDRLSLDNVGKIAWMPLTTIVEVKPTITTGAVSILAANKVQITSNNAISGNGELVISRGVCYATSPIPTVDNEVVINGSGLGSFSVYPNTLLPNTTYYARAFATSIYGTSYGSEINFTTMDGIPVGLTTIPVTSVQATTANGSLTYTSDGGAPVIIYGLCVSTSPTPTNADILYTNGYIPPATIGSFSITGLMTGTTYYVRSYLLNVNGPYYGNELSFTTQSGIITSVTSPATSISSTTATIVGNITNFGGTSVLTPSTGPLRGICFGTSPNPTITANKISISYNTLSTLSSYTAYIGAGGSWAGATDPPLLPNTTYYYRAYAKSVLGVTHYGNELSFTTLP
jgi:hypothetical protein